MEILLIILLIVIVTALIVANLPRLRGGAANRRLRPGRRRDVAPAPDQTGAMHHVPDDDEVRMRAQAHREATTRQR